MEISPQLGILLAVLAAAALSAIAASGLTVMAMTRFFKILLDSPAALRVVEGMITSFPPQTRELLHVVARFVEEVTDEQATALPGGTKE